MSSDGCQCGQKQKAPSPLTWTERLSSLLHRFVYRPLPTYINVEPRPVELNARPPMVIVIISIAVV